MSNMENSLYQNIDAPSSNPLEQELSQPQEKKKINIFEALKNIKDPKIKILLILGIVLIILLALSLIVTVFRKKPTIEQIAVPTPIPQISPVPTRTSNIPIEFIDKFNQIEEKLKLNEDFQPPQIDSETGL